MNLMGQTPDLNAAECTSKLLLKIAPVVNFPAFNFSFIIGFFFVLYFLHGIPEPAHPRVKPLFGMAFTMGAFFIIIILCSERDRPPDPSLDIVYIFIATNKVGRSTQRLCVPTFLVYF